MIKESTKKKIKSKFGTITKFCNAANIDRYVFQKNYLSKKYISPQDEIELLELIKSTDFVNRDELTYELKVKIKRGIERRGGVIKFCLEHGIVENTVYQILGAGHYKKITPKVKQIMDILKIKR